MPLIESRPAETPRRSAQAAWWRDGVIYQIYPRSFQDSNGDGVGDLPGILSRLDYLVSLGVDALWISPFYPSPMADFGYDVADYTGVEPVFGTMADFDALLEETHARGLKLIVDFVPNHTSDQHPWFVESRSSRDNPRRDWYLWRDSSAPGEAGEEAAPPNNWRSNFGGTAWTWHENTRQFFYHSFLRRQPDLNWHNPAVREAMFAAMSFWLDKGVDGFRMDVLWLLIKDDKFRSNLPNPEFSGGSSFWSVLPTYTADQPETHAIVCEMRSLLDTYADRGERVLIGEIYLPVQELVKYYGPIPSPGEGTPRLAGAQMPFNFHLIQTAWQAEAIASLIVEYEAALPTGAWPNWVLGNHDQHRLATRIGAAQARVAAVLILTLRGTPTLYYGDELGMTDALILPDQVRDPAERNQPGLGLGRDPERSPMLWDLSAHAGFTSPGAEPWLPLLTDFRSHSVCAQETDARSMLTLYRHLLALRRSASALHSGDMSEVSAEAGVLRYTRCDRQKSFQIVLNLTSESRCAEVVRGRMVLNSFLDQNRTTTGGTLSLRPNEAILIETG